MTMSKPGIMKFDFKKVKVEDPEGPYPDFARPHPEECVLATELLGELHGIPTRGENTMPVLDSLVRTILSQNTTDKNSRVAFLNLKKHFPTWLEVYNAGGTGRVEESIKSGGLSVQKAFNIHIILSYLLQEHADKCPQGEPSYEWLRNESSEFCKMELAKHKGVGPKTVSCVLMFNLARADFPVDTHVWFIAKKLGWVPGAATAETSYAHLNVRVPAEVKYALHILLVEHGKRCPRCAKGGKLQLEQEGECPLASFQDKVEAFRKAPNSIKSSNSPKKDFVPWYVKTDGCEMVKGESSVKINIKQEVVEKEEKVRIKNEPVGGSGSLKAKIKEEPQEIKKEIKKETPASSRKRKILQHLDMQG